MKFKTYEEFVMCKDIEKLNEYIKHLETKEETNDTIFLKSIVAKRIDNLLNPPKPFDFVKRGDIVEFGDGDSTFIIRADEVSVEGDEWEDNIEDENWIYSRGAGYDFETKIDKYAKIIKIWRANTDDNTLYVVWEEE